MIYSDPEIAREREAAHRRGHDYRAPDGTIYPAPSLGDRMAPLLICVFFICLGALIIYSVMTGQTPASGDYDPIYRRGR